jgi:hypothetical protein
MSAAYSIVIARFREQGHIITHLKHVHKKRYRVTSNVIYLFCFLRNCRVICPVSLHVRKGAHYFYM